jgi:hypothetical protein
MLQLTIRSALVCLAILQPTIYCALFCLAILQPTISSTLLSMLILQPTTNSTHSVDATTDYPLYNRSRRAASWRSRRLSGRNLD